MTDDLWTIIRSSSDGAVIKALGDYLTARNFSCRLCDPQPSSPNTYSLLVPHRRIDDINRILDWVSVVSYPDAISANVMADSLSLSEIPATVDGGFRRIGPFHVLVPRLLRERALEIFNEPPLSDDELTAQAMAAAPKHHGER